MIELGLTLYRIVYFAVGFMIGYDYVCRRIEQWKNSEKNTN